MNPGKITVASVKVMRSHDYCHFEVQLGTDISAIENDIAAVDELRKTAARLADKAVSQYQIMKAAAVRRQAEVRDRDYHVRRMAEIAAKEPLQRTVGEQAELKAFDDAKWETSREYDYEDDWQGDDGV